MLCGISFIVFVIAVLIYVGIMVHDLRTLWSGVSFWGMLACLVLLLFFKVSEYSAQLASSGWIIGILVALFIAVVLCVLALPGFMVLMFCVEGIKVIRREGMKLSNLLSLLFAVLLYGYLVVWPRIRDLAEHTFGTVLYAIVSFAAAYMLILMSMYTFSALLNLFHLKKNRGADYIVVLGSEILGTRVTPLLAARIDKGIELLTCNQDAVMILSGGQGPGEDISEGEAMVAYAVEKGVDKKRIRIESKSVSTEENLLFSRRVMEKERPKVILVTTVYHVFRALLLARRQGMKCVGYGAKTKWYFTLNALLREFAGYLKMTWKFHALVVGIAAGITIAVRLIALFL